MAPDQLATTGRSADLNEGMGVPHRGSSDRIAVLNFLLISKQSDENKEMIVMTWVGRWFWDLPARSNPVKGN